MKRREWLTVATVLFCLDNVLSGPNEILCGQYDKFNSTTGNFTVNADVWNPDTAGGQCLSVDPNGTAFNATWNWESGPDSVHSYPHVSFHSSVLPLPFSNVSSLTVRGAWNIFPTSSSGKIPGFGSLNLRANVALDLFADLDPNVSQNETQAGFEIMIWIASFGGAKPIGYSRKSGCLTQYIGDVPFSLYVGNSQRGHQVFTWVSLTNMSNFDIDLTALFQALWKNNLVPSNASLGLVEFGSEAFHSSQNVTFAASDFGMDLSPGSSPDLNITIASGPCHSKASLWRQSRSSSFCTLFMIIILSLVLLS